PSLSSSLHGHGAPRDLHSFPTRRSSDLPPEVTLHPVRSSCKAIWSALPSDPFPPTCSAHCAWPASSTSPKQPVSAAASPPASMRDRKSTRLNSSHVKISYAVFCLKKKTK